jgi:hypothetical protein
MLDYECVHKLNNTERIIDISMVEREYKRLLDKLSTRMAKNQGRGPAGSGWKARTGDRFGELVYSMTTPHYASLRPGPLQWRLTAKSRGRRAHHMAMRLLHQLVLGR